jgi:osmotically-inducible protein OsmY
MRSDWRFLSQIERAAEIASGITGVLRVDNPLTNRTG